MSPLSTALIQILNGVACSSGNADIEEIYTFIQKELLKKDSDLYTYLEKAGISEENMAEFVLAQYYQCLLYEDPPTMRLDGE